MYKIQEFSQKTGISKRMLRYLEEQKVLIPIRKENDYRLYDDKHLEEIHWIQFWQKLGFSLVQIKTLKNLPVIKFEDLLETILISKIDDLKAQSNQISNIRKVIKKIREIDPQQLDMRNHFSTLESLTSDTREEFISMLFNHERIVYGKFPELDLKLDKLAELMKENQIQLDIISCDIMKMGEAITHLPASEIIVWERKSDYSFFCAAMPESLLHENFYDKFEQDLRHSLQKSLNDCFYFAELSEAGRFFDVRDILQVNASNEITFRLSFKIPQGHQTFECFIFIPFHFVHAARGGLNGETSVLGRSLQRSFVELTDEQILKKTKTISNQKYLLTALLADESTRYRMFSVLTSEAKENVTKELSNLMTDIQDAWSD